jgi:hypothetical protein
MSRHHPEIERPRRLFENGIFFGPHQRHEEDGPSPLDIFLNLFRSGRREHPHRSHHRDHARSRSRSRSHRHGSALDDIGAIEYGIWYIAWRELRREDVRAGRPNPGELNNPARPGAASPMVVSGPGVPTGPELQTLMTEPSVNERTHAMLWRCTTEEEAREVLRPYIQHLRDGTAPCTVRIRRRRRDGHGRARHGHRHPGRPHRQSAEEGRELQDGVSDAGLAEEAAMRLPGAQEFWEQYAAQVAVAERGDVLRDRMTGLFQVFQEHQVRDMREAMGTHISPASESSVSTASTWLDGHWELACGVM